MPVDTLHPEYIKFKPRWDLTRALMESDAHKYIKDVDPLDEPRSLKYREDAVLTNFTARTVNGLVGMVFRKDGKKSLPPLLEYLEDDATGDNLSLDQCAKEGVEETLVTGRYGLLSDFPAVVGNFTKRDLLALDLKARIYPFKAEEIINWSETIINGVKVLEMVTVKECFTSLYDDGFVHYEDVRYITMRLVDGVYVQEIRGKDKKLIGDIIAPKKNNQQYFGEIPFAFIGSRKNRPKPEISPIYDIACLNIAHLKNSASFEESIAVLGQPSLFITTSIGADEFERLNPQGIKYGSRRGHNLGDTGSATLLQAQPNQLADQGMIRKEEQAVMIGARLLQKQGGTETAEAARIRSQGEISVLDSVATNVGEGFRKAIKWCAEFMGANPDDVEYELNYEFFDPKSDPQEIMAGIQLFDRGVVAEQDLRNLARQGGMIDPTRTDEEIVDDVRTASPL